MNTPSHLPLAGSELPRHFFSPDATDADPQRTLHVVVRLVPDVGDAAMFRRADAMGRQPLRERRYLDRRQLGEFAPDPRAHDALTSFCRQHGLHAEREALGGLCVTLSGTTRDLEQAFGVKLRMHKGYRGYQGAIHLPAALHPHVRAVLGLDECSRKALEEVPRAKTAPPMDPVGVPAHPSNPPRTVAYDYYGFPSQYTGQGATVAYVESDLSVDTQQIQTFFDWLGVGTVNMQLVRGKVSGTQPPQDGEAMMDLKLTGAVAPGATLVAYGINQQYGYCEDGWIDALLMALQNAQHMCDVMSISLGSPESAMPTQTEDTINFIFALAGMSGVTICVSSGDFGAAGREDGTYAQNCAFPASSPYCLACGGTALWLEMTPDGLVLRDEIVWNQMTAPYQKLATGGGISMRFPPPSYQQGLTLPAPLNPSQGPGRAVPDVASNASSASGYQLAIPPRPSDGYGTSAAAPMWAALMALIVQSDPAHPPGWVNPLLYQAQLDGGDCCRPIVQGSNGAPGSSIAFSAGAPWNACCGLGSPKGAQLLAALRPTGVQA